MNISQSHELEQRIHSFMDRKTRQFPELEQIATKRARKDLLTRVQDFVTVWPHSGHARHSH